MQVVVSKVTKVTKTNEKAFGVAQLDAEATAIEVARISEEAIEANNLKSLPAFNFSAGTIKVSVKKQIVK